MQTRAWVANCLVAQRFDLISVDFVSICSRRHVLAGVTQAQLNMCAAWLLLLLVNALQCVLARVCAACLHPQLLLLAVAGRALVGQQQLQVLMAAPAAAKQPWDVQPCSQLLCPWHHPWA
jgi:hypothetical protein